MEKIFQAKFNGIYLPESLPAHRILSRGWGRLQIAGSLCMGNEKLKEYVKLNSAASPCSPSLNFCVVHQRTAGLPGAIHKAFAFCLLPSRQAAILCRQMEEVPVCGMRRSCFREGMSHSLFLCTDIICRSAVL